MTSFDVVAVAQTLAAHKTASVALVVVGTAVFVRQAAMNPQGFLRRSASAYVARLDERFTSMFLSSSTIDGARVAWLQLCGALALLLLRGFIPSDVLIALAFAALALPPLMIGVLVTRRARALAGQVPTFALALANALKTTASIGDALHVTVIVTDKPLRQELETALKQVRIGSTLEEALLAMSARVRSPSLDVVVSALLIGRQTGGDLPRILEGTALSLRELRRLEELTEKVIRSARMSLAVAASITTGFAIFLPRIVPGFFDPLSDTVKGQIVVAECAIAFLLALYLGYRFTRIDV